MAESPKPGVPPEMADFVVGIIGMGDMGKMYARQLSEIGWRIMACDREENYEKLQTEFTGTSKIQILRNGHLVSRASDYIIYSVEASAIDRVVAEYGPSTKLGAIVGGQTSCKDPEIKAFEAHLPSDVEIVSCHSLHGPKVDTRNQPLVLIRHRASDSSFAKIELILSSLRSKHVYLTATEHDRITADTQAVTHAAFLSMGTAWHAQRQFPWETARYVGGIENAKVNLCLRIYSQKWHVYAGLAILNPQARNQIHQYARSVTELFKLMLGGKGQELRERVLKARDKVFGFVEEGEDGDGDGDEGKGKGVRTGGRLRGKSEPLLPEGVLDRFSIGPPPTAGPSSATKELANSHLSLLAMVDCWATLNIVPYEHMICSTPLFRLWLGVTEHLFRHPGLLDAALSAAVEEDAFRGDDLEFALAARAWAECVARGQFDNWRDRFVDTQRFFEARFEGAVSVGNEMVRVVLESMKK